MNHWLVVFFQEPQIAVETLMVLHSYCSLPFFKMSANNEGITWITSSWTFKLSVVESYLSNSGTSIVSDFCNLLQEYTNLH